MFKIGLTGGICTGKSYILDIFNELGCYTLRADSIAKKIIFSSDSQIREEIINNFGADIYDEKKGNDEPDYYRKLYDFIIEGNTITKNDFAGIYLRDSNDNKIKRNVITANGYHGVFMFGDNYRNQIGQNIVTNHSQTAVLIHGGSNNSILQNHIVGNKHGITISYSSLNYINYNNIGALARGNTTNKIIQTKMLSDIYGGHLDRPHRTEAEVNCFLNYEFHVAVSGNLPRPHSIR